MRTIAITFAMLAVVLATLPSLAQSPSFAQVCEDVEIPTRAEYESNGIAYADNFCALATYAPHRVARQFNSMIALVRAHNNPNRFYWDPRKQGVDTGLYIQLLRPWMAEQGWWIHQMGPATGVIGRGLSTNNFVRMLFFSPEEPWKEQASFELGIIRNDNWSIFLDGRERYTAYLVRGLSDRGGVGSDRYERVCFRLDQLVQGGRLYFNGPEHCDEFSATGLTAAVHHVLDCLSDPVVREDWAFRTPEQTDGFFHPDRALETCDTNLELEDRDFASAEDPAKNDPP